MAIIEGSSVHNGHTFCPFPPLFMAIMGTYRYFCYDPNHSKIIYPRGMGPTYELYSSSRRTAVVRLLKNYMQFFLVIFLGWVMLPHPQATSTDHGGPRTSDLSIERRRRNHFTTAPPIREGGNS